MKVVSSTSAMTFVLWTVGMMGVTSQELRALGRHGNGPQGNLQGFGLGGGPRDGSTTEQGSGTEEGDGRRGRGANFRQNFPFWGPDRDQDSDRPEKTGEFWDAASQNPIYLWLPRCFRTTDPQDLYDCVKRYADRQDCVIFGNDTNVVDADAEGDPETSSNGTTFAELVECIRENDPELVDEVEEEPEDTTPLSDLFERYQNRRENRRKRRKRRQRFINATAPCLDEVADCLNETIQEARQNHPRSCIRQALRSLHQCGRENAATCRANCSAQLPLDNPFAGVNYSALTTCADIQTELIAPTCEIVSCCPPCALDPLEELMDCLVNQVANITDETCDVSCAAAVPSLDDPLAEETAVTLSLDGPDNNNRVLAESQNDDDDTSMDVCLQYAPSALVDGEDAALDSTQVFLPCTYTELVQVMEDTVDAVEGDTSLTGTSAAFARAGGGMVTVLVGLFMMFVLVAV